MKFLRQAIPLPVLAVILAASWTPAASAAPGAKPPSVEWKLVETPAEVRVETAAYTLVITREGFGWTLLRAGAPVLRSSPPTAAAPNAAIIIEGKPERATTLKSVQRVGDRLALEYNASRKK